MTADLRRRGTVPSSSPLRRTVSPQYTRYRQQTNISPVPKAHPNAVPKRGQELEMVAGWQAEEGYSTVSPRARQHWSINSSLRYGSEQLMLCYSARVWNERLIRQTDRQTDTALASSNNSCFVLRCLHHSVMAQDSQSSRRHKHKFKLH